MRKGKFLSSVTEAVAAISVLKESTSLAFLEEAATRIATCFKRGGKLLIAGNGGSLADAMHFAEELTGQFREKRPALPAIALADATHMSCVANDFGYAEVFARGVEAFGKPEDLFVGLSTSGNSPNLVRAFEEAKEKKVETLAFLGKGGGQLKGVADLEWIINGFSTSDRIQEVHMAGIHIIIEGVEAILFPKESPDEERAEEGILTALKR